jgi:SOS response regulatory protein OraA/RecX
LYASREAKGRFVDIQTYEQVVAERATASEIRKALGIKRENTERIRQIIRDLEEKNWQID